jgi:hypothetical protein
MEDAHHCHRIRRTEDRSHEKALRPSDIGAVDVSGDDDENEVAEAGGQADGEDDLGGDKGETRER